MRKILKYLVLFVAFVLMITNFYVSADTTTNLSLTVDTIFAEPGNSYKVNLKTNGFTGFSGAYNFEVKFPEIAEIIAVYFDGEKLTSVFDGGSDYNIYGDNILIIADTCNYGGDTALSDSKFFEIEFTISDSAAIGTYPLNVTEDTYATIDEDLVSVTGYDGAIIIEESVLLKADINNDGTANATDLSALRINLLDNEYDGAFFRKVADINKDNKIDIKDLVSFKKYLTRLVVYLSDNGNDANIGDSADYPVATIDRAIDQVYEGGTVYITDTFTPSSTWSKHYKKIEISGGIFNASSLSTVTLSDSTKFTDVTLNFKSGSSLYAGGNKLIIADDVTVNGNPYVYGGDTVEVASTDIEIYSGSYQRIYGGGNGANVIGNTNVKVGGTVNSDLDETNHSGGVYIIAGCNNATVGGNTYLIVEGSTKSTHIFGAGVGASSTVVGKTNVIINGGAFMSAYAGSTNGKCSDTELTLAGGTIEQVFGGNSSSSMTGNTKLNIIGGTVTRRIYGGCYNEATRSGLNLNWASTNHVTGNTTVLLSSDADVVFNTDFDDYGIFACTRYKSHFLDENSTLIYEDSAAKSEFEGKIGQKQGLLYFFFPSAANNIITQS